MSDFSQPESASEATPMTFYVTTPIYYVNARPHIGHAYSTIVADVLARRHRLLGEDVFFLTGTDEHGQKIERSAAAAGVPPQEFADRVSKTFSDLWQRMGITNNDFIRTTEERHKRGVQKLFRDLYDAGHIYLSTYTGQYSIGEEMFVDGPPGTIGPDGRPTETVTEENFFFRLSDFQLPLIEMIESDALKITPESSKNEVLSFVTGDFWEAMQPAVPGVTAAPSGFFPALEQQALKSGKVARTSGGFLYVPDALRNLSVSRSSFSWGIPVPEEILRDSAPAQNHVIYVWLDALANYMTAIGYGNEAEQDHFHKYWPADLHLVGKEITRFHCVYWPAFLLALNPKLKHRPDEPMPVLTLSEHREWADRWLPKEIRANGWLLFDDVKMSKSKGNVVRTETILDAFGEHVYKKQFPESSKSEQDLFATDVLRYFLLREIPFGQDGTFSFDSMWSRYDSELGNKYGNLVSRVLSMISKYFDGTIPETEHLNPEAENPGDLAVSIHGLEAVRRMTRPDWREIPALVFDTDQHTVLGSNFSASLALINSYIADVDTYLSRQAPWKLASDPIKQADLTKVLYTAAESVRIITCFLYPILPLATGKVWRQLGLGDIESAVVAGDLRDPTWGGLAAGTKLGTLAPIFPRADKSLPQIMADMELTSATPTPTQEAPIMPTEDTSQERAVAGTHPAAPLKGATTPAAASEVVADSTDPAAPPRTSTLETANPGGDVGASGAITTERVGTPPHQEAAASGIFAGGAETAQIGIEDFTKVDLRVAKIVVAERIPKADKLLRLEVDLGYEQRQILSGIAEWYTPEELVGRTIVIVANLAPRKMRGLESRGMLLAASEGEGGKPVLATFGEGIAVGTRLR